MVISALLATLLLMVQEPPNSWETLETPGLIVSYAAGDSLRAARLFDFFQSLPGLPGLPRPPDSVRVYLAPDEEAFDALTGGRVPEWGAAVALPSLGTIVMPGYTRGGSRSWDDPAVLRHEWAHVGLHAYLGRLRVPRWFDEGYAEWASGSWDASQGWRLRVAITLGRAPPLDSLALRWPRDRASAELAYLLSATAVEYLALSGGERGVRLFLEEWKETRSFSRALRSVYGATPYQLEDDWRKYVRKRYGWLLVFSQSLVFWLLLSVLLLIMVWIRRGRNREAMARLRAGEPEDNPDYWTAAEAESSGAAPDPGPHA